MTGQHLLLLALTGILLTQAIFAKDAAGEFVKRLDPEDGEPAMEDRPNLPRDGTPSFMKSALKKVETIVDRFLGKSAEDSDNNDGKLPPVSSSDDGGFDDKDIEASRLLAKMHPSHKSEGNEGFKDYPLPPKVYKHPKQVEWDRHSPFNFEASPSDDKLNSPVVEKSSGRKVKSITISGNDVTSSTAAPDNEVEHHIVKRSPGAGIPDAFEFTLEALAPFATANPTYKIGSIIPYKLTVHASIIETDVKVEIFSELSGGAYFMVSNVRIGAVGSNFDTFKEEEVVIRYYSKFNDGRWDYATVDLGDIHNKAGETVDASKSKMEVLFEMTALPHQALEANVKRRVSVGAMYMSESYVTVAQDDLTYEVYTPRTDTPEATFTIKGPDKLDMGLTGVWQIEAAIHDLYSDVALDVLAPLHTTGVMTIDRISVLEFGSNYQYSSVAFSDGENFTRLTYENYGNYGRLDLGTIVNTGYHEKEDGVSNNTITFQVAITMLEHEYNETSPYTVGFTVWKKDMDSIEIMWSAQKEVQATNTTLAALATSPVFSWKPTAATVVFGGRFAVILNMSVPSPSSAKYVLEASIPVNDSQAMMEIENVRMSRIGFNMPHVSVWHENSRSNYTEEKTDSTSTDFISWDIGIITNTGQSLSSDDQILQFEIMIKLLETASNYYNDTDSMYISLGMKHAEDYYWVGRTSIAPTTTPIQYSGDKVPEFTYVNVMGADAQIYPDSAAVLDLDMNVPAGVDYDSLTMEISTSNTSDSVSKLRIVSVEPIHIGKALYVAGLQSTSYNSSNSTDQDEKDRQIFTTAVLKMERLTSLRDENFGRYAYEDSTIRIRTTVVARSSTEAAFIDGEVYWTEVTVNFAGSYIYAARSGVQYNSTVPNVYLSVSGAIPKWQPYTNFDVKRGSTAVVAKGTPLVYNVTIGVPYRTATDLLVKIQSDVPQVQICQVKFVKSGSSIVKYDPPTYEGDVINSTVSVGGSINMAKNYKPMVTSFDYGYFVGDVRDSYLSYEAIVMLNDEAAVGSNYTFSSSIAIMYNALTFDATKTVAVVDKEAASTKLPEVYLSKYDNSTNKINVGGSELYYVDVYVVPGTQHHMVVNIFAPWNDTGYGNYEILEAYVVFAGKNLVCYDNTLTKVNMTRSSDNLSGRKNLAIVTLGYVPSLSDSSEVEVEANKLRILVHVAVPFNTSVTPGDTLPVASTIDIDGSHLWVGYVDSVLVPFNDASNENDNGTVSLNITADSDSIFSIRETQSFTAVLTIPAGAAYPDFKINLKSPIDDGESRVKIFNVKYVRSGRNLLELKGDHLIEATDNLYNVSDIQTIDFKFVRNTDITRLNPYCTPPPAPEDNEIEFSFDIELQDTVALIDGFEFPIDAYISRGALSLIQHVGNMTITVESPEDDNAVFNWNVAIEESPTKEYDQDSTIVFGLDIELAETAKRFPSDVVINFRVPYFSVLNSDGPFNVTGGLASEFTASSKVEQYGLKFTWAKMRWPTAHSLKFNITVDPNHTVEPGLLERTVTIPVDVSFKRENRTAHGTYDEWYTEMKVLTFKLQLPELIDALGMESLKIDDCQITASSHHNDSTKPANARPTKDGWSSETNRGPPLYQNEYIQVDMGAYVKFTGITLYPYNDEDLSRVKQFKVQYSRKGIRWDYALDIALETKTFTVTWPSPLYANTSVFLPLDKSAFIARYIRILPQLNDPSSYTSKLRLELNGYPWPYKAELPTYQCPSPANNNLKTYVDRQILAVPGSNELYACTIPQPGKKPYCSGTDDFGASWFAIDDNVLNVYGYDSSTNALYGLGRDRKACLRSKDGGHSWKAIECSRYNAVKGTITFTDAKEVPFGALEGKTSGDLLSGYGFEMDESHSLSVSRKAVHAHGTDKVGVASKTDNEDQVAYWGNKVWNGP